ncbi:MAG: DUF4301 family protein [Desulfuromonadales bacterium]|jgi:hypothetical protein
MTFSEQDRQQLAAIGLPPQDAERQIKLLSSGQAEIKLERPCRPGDGIIQLAQEQAARCQEMFDQAVAAGRLLRFVPASGAASRMFSPLRVAPETLEEFHGDDGQQATSEAIGNLNRFLDALPRFAFFADLEQALADDGHNLQQAMAARDLALIIRYLLEPCGLGYAQLPKGLLAFHATADGIRTPFIEHLAEAALLAGLDREVALHFTVSPEHLPLFKAQFAAWQETLESTYGCDFRVSYSVQKPATDTLALDPSGQPLRTASGQLVLRPGGHGALLENLNDLAGDIILIRNIDNVVPDQRKHINLEWTKRLVGYLLDVQQEQQALLKALHGQPNDPVVQERVLSFLNDRLQCAIPAAAPYQELLAWLDRPLRVCGMVPSSGEPGGGPFWIRDHRGRMSRQIVEGAQIDSSDPNQAAILKQSTHFNPVDMVCGVRDWQQRPYDLSRYVDQDAVIITCKDQDGQTVRVLERPGLWNGSMAGWHTLFVEIPPEAFNPVKTVFDLLRPAHQPG